MKPSSANVGAAAEALVCSRLLMLGLDVARPLADNGVDFWVSAPDGREFVPLQVKSASTERILFKREWFQKAVPDLVLAFAFLSTGQVFVFDGIGEVEAFLGASTATPSWLEKGEWAINTLGPTHRRRLAPFNEAWGKIRLRLDRRIATARRAD